MTQKVIPKLWYLQFSFSQVLLCFIFSLSFSTVKCLVHWLLPYKFSYKIIAGMEITSNLNLKIFFNVQITSVVLFCLIVCLGVWWFQPEIAGLTKYVKRACFLVIYG